MEYLQADYVFPVTSNPIRNGIIAVETSGVIRQILDPESSPHLPDPVMVKKYNGFLCPGFINCHCHLELSFLINKIPTHTGITGFIKGLLAERNKATIEEINHAISCAEEEMISNGIVAVGDISNTPDTFSQKAKNNLHYHTFIELFDLGENKTEETYLKGLDLWRQLQAVIPPGHTSSLTPHSPYTVSGKLFSRINKWAFENDSISAIHNQESESENELFISKSGVLFDFFSASGIPLDYIAKTGMPSIRTTLAMLSDCKKILLVHNTYTRAEEITWANHYVKMLYWCFCIKANLYIENKVPEIPNFRVVNDRLTLGTDSLASNNSLSILDEIKTIISFFPSIPFHEILRWGTINGAEFLGISKMYGSLDAGKKPGINLIENTDAASMNITAYSQVKKLY